MSQKAIVTKPKKGGISHYIEDQIKNILAMSGGIFESVKGLKAIYAVLQSLARDEFPLQWDVIFFSIYSRKLMSELSYLCLEKGDIKEVLWREKGSSQPFHHIYILTPKAKRTITSSFYEDYEKPYYSDLIVWSLLEPKFSIYWSYFLEMYTFQKMPDAEKKLPFLALLENDKFLDGNEKKRLIKLRDRLCQHLSTLGIQSLEIIKPSYAEKNNLYIFLPFQMDGTRRRKFLDFYEKGQHNKYVSVTECEKHDESNLLDVKINPDGIKHIYDYINLSKEEIQKERSRFDIPTEKFEELIDNCTSQLYRRIPEDNEGGRLAYYQIVEAAKNKQEFLNNIPEKLKQKVIERAKELLLTLDEFYDLAQWRYSDIISMLVKLAEVSQGTAINLFFENYNLNGYLNDTCVDEQTMIGFEFSDDFRKGYKDKFGYQMPSNSLHHVCHFVQPGEALKAIYKNKENCLLEGGPVIGEY